MNITMKKKIWIISIVFFMLTVLWTFGLNYQAHADDSTPAQIHGSASHQHHPVSKDHRKFFPLFKESASILGMDEKSLKQSLQAGKSLVDIAKEKGISEKELKSKLMNLRNNKIDQAMQSGKIDQKQAKSIKQKMDAHLDFMLHSKQLWSMHQHWKMNHRFGYHPFRPNLQQIAEMIGISKEQLIKEMQSGKSITEIASARGITRAQLLTKIKDYLTPMIEKQMDRKWLENNK